jgi:hypothetical protein
MQSRGKLTGCKDTDKTDPSKPANTAKSTDTRETESNNSGNGNKYSGTCAMSRDSVQTDRDTQHTRTGDEDPVFDIVSLNHAAFSRALTKAESYSQNLTANTAKHQITSIVDAVNLGVATLENSNHVIRPSRDAGDDNKADDTRNDAKDVENGGDRQDAKTDLGLHHEGNGADPTDL